MQVSDDYQPWIKAPNAISDKLRPLGKMFQGLAFLLEAFNGSLDQKWS